MYIFWYFFTFLDFFLDFFCCFYGFFFKLLRLQLKITKVLWNTKNGLKWANGATAGARSRPTQQAISSRRHLKLNIPKGHTILKWRFQIPNWWWLREMIFVYSDRVVQHVDVKECGKTLVHCQCGTCSIKSGQVIQVFSWLESTFVYMTWLNGLKSKDNTLKCFQ